MIVKQSFQKLILVFSLIVIFCILWLSVAQAQDTTNSSLARGFISKDFSEKIALAIMSAFLGLGSGLFLSQKNRRDGAIELSYSISLLSVLEFKKDIGDKITIGYGDNHNVADVYLISCDIENTCKKVIKNEYITFEIRPSRVGILDRFFEPQLKDNLMGIEQITIEDVKPNEFKSRYLIRDILPGQKVGFRFVTVKLDRQETVPSLFVSNKNDSKTELLPKQYQRERDKSDRIMQFVTLLILFFVLPSAVSWLFLDIYFLKGFFIGFIRLAIFVRMFPYINTFSEAIAKLLSQEKSRIPQIQPHNYVITTNDRSPVSITHDSNIYQSSYKEQKPEEK